MEPVFNVSHKLKPILEELQRLEPLFHAAYVEASPERFEQLVAPEFWEIGASGRRYSREFALALLINREQMPQADAWQTSDFHVTEAGTDSYLLTYNLYQPGRVTRRMTVWRRHQGAWQAVYHQGTVVVE